MVNGVHATRGRRGRDEQPAPTPTPPASPTRSPSPAQMVPTAMALAVFAALQRVTVLPGSGPAGVSQPGQLGSAAANVGARDFSVAAGAPALYGMPQLPIAGVAGVPAAEARQAALDGLGLRCVEVPADGDCFYHSVAHFVSDRMHACGGLPMPCLAFLPATHACVHACAHGHSRTLHAHTDRRRRLAVGS